MFDFMRVSPFKYLHENSGWHSCLMIICFRIMICRCWCYLFALSVILSMLTVVPCEVIFPKYKFCGLVRLRFYCRWFYFAPNDRMRRAEYHQPAWSFFAVLAVERWTRKLLAAGSCSWHLTPPVYTVSEDFHRKKSSVDSRTDFSLCETWD